MLISSAFPDIENTTGWTNLFVAPVERRETMHFLSISQARTFLACARFNWFTQASHHARWLFGVKLQLDAWRSGLTAIWIFRIACLHDVFLFGVDGHFAVFHEGPRADANTVVDHSPKFYHVYLLCLRLLGFFFCHLEKLDGPWLSFLHDYLRSFWLDDERPGLLDVHIPGEQGTHCD